MAITTKKTTKPPTAAARTAAAAARKEAGKPTAPRAKSAPRAQAQVRADAAVGPEAAVKVEKANVEVKLKALVERVAASSGVKKAQVKAVAEALLQEMGEALSAGQVLNLPGFGKARVARPAETPTGSMTIKLRRGNGGGGRPEGDGPEGDGPEALASPGEDS